MFYPLKCSFTCTYNPLFYKQVCFISKSVVVGEINIYNLFTPRYTAKIGVKHQPINPSRAFK